MQRDENSGLNSKKKGRKSVRPVALSAQIAEQDIKDINNNEKKRFA